MEQPKSCLKLVHLAVNTRADHFFLTRNAEILQGVNTMLLHGSP